MIFIEESTYYITSGWYAEDVESLSTRHYTNDGNHTTDLALPIKIQIDTIKLDTSVLDPSLQIVFEEQTSAFCVTDWS